MVEDDLQQLHEVLLDAYQALGEWRGVLPPGTSIGTAFAFGEVLVALAKASEMVGQDIDEGGRMTEAPIRAKREDAAEAARIELQAREDPAQVDTSGPAP